MRKRFILGVALGVALAGSAHGSIRHGLREAPALVDLPLTDPRYKNAVDLIVEAAARNVPVPASGSDYTFRWDPSTGKYERTSGTFGPLSFMERAETIGQNMWNVGATFQYLELDEFDGHTVGKDPNAAVIGGEAFFFSVTPKIIYHVTTLNVTYGITNDLDVNVAVPVIALDFDANARRQSADGGPVFINAEHGRVSIGIGDIHLRAKYHVLDWEGIQMALGLDTRLPTGHAPDALGTGTGTIMPYLAFSHRYFDWIEPHLNAGFEFDVVESDHSRAHYSLGTTFKPCEWFDVAFSLLGQSEVDGVRSAASISGPHVVNGATVNAPYEGVNGDRKDYFDTMIGARFRIWETLTFMGGMMKSLNDDGLRSSNWSPILAFEGTF